jgi:hypothetical protein
MNTKKTVFSKIAKGMPKKQVKLSIVSEIDDQYDWFEQSYSEAAYGVEFMKEWIDKIMDFNTELSIAVDNYVVNGAAYSFQDAYTDMRSKIETLEEKANDLGINPSELIRDYDEIKNILGSAESVDDEFRSSYKELLRQANERFGLADFS